MSDNAPTPVPTFISFSAEINETTAEGLISVVAQQMSKGTRDIYLLLSSPGGGAAQGIMLYNTLRGLPINLTTHNVGNVNSIGNIIFLAGNQRYACKTSSFMFHGVGFNVSQAARFEEKDLKEKLDAVTNDQGLISDILSDRTNINTEEAAGLFLRAAFMRAEVARERGIIDDIREVCVPKGATFLQLSFKR